MSSENVYQIRIDLQYAKPPIWRRVLVPTDIMLDEMHAIIQAVFSWDNSHLHCFIDGYFDDYSVFIGPPSVDVEMDEAECPLVDVLAGEGDRLIYEYDFGDSWRHVLKVEKVLPREEVEAEYDQLPVCIKGRLAAPPDDIGGIGGYYYSLEILQDPNHEQYEDYKGWYEESFDPEVFDIDEANERLQNRGRYIMGPF